ncbi:MAG: FAD-dependent oxidoreductase [Deltaproteobacteria bacterium]|nr:FAD-dependent oxidoreductase [Deltaproteobacteria bacterium]
MKNNSNKKLLVVGAGAAGMEAAVTAAKAGHKVTLFEKDSDIGGQLWIAGAPPNKQEFWEFIRYYRAMIRKYGITLRLNTEVDLDLIRKENPDHVIIAEGAEALIPPVEGIDDPAVISAWEVLKKNPLLGKDVAVIGGGAVGLETALFVAAKGTITAETLHFLFAYEAEPVKRLRELMFKGSSSVTVFEMLPMIGKDVGKSVKWVLDGNLKRYGVKILKNAKVVLVKNGLVKYEIDDKTEQMQFDTVILASGSRSVQRISNEIEKLGIPFTTIGDCVRPGKIDGAVHGGFLAAMNI